MVFVRIDAELKLFASILQRSDHIGSILEMHIVVACAMYEKVVTLEQVGKVKRRIVIIATGIVLRTLEETLSVDVVVVTPSDDRSHSDSAFEHIVTFKDGKCGEVAAKTPAKDADTALVNPALFAKAASQASSHSILPRFL